MKTSDLVSKLTSMGYKVKIKPRMKGKRVVVYTNDGIYAGNVCTEVFGTLDTDTWVTTSGKSAYDTDDVNDLVDTLATYALTPLDKQGDTKKYLVKMLPEGDNYLNQDKDDNHIFCSSKEETKRYKTHFTEQEYNEVQKQNTTWLPKFDTKDPHFVEVHD